jgi:imidazolonepropionase-like amidohydrolase
VTEPSWAVAPAVTDAMTLDQVVAASARSPESVVLIGSATGELRPGSDLDLLVVPGDDAPAGVADALAFWNGLFDATMLRAQ